MKLKLSRPIRTILVIWLAWAAILLGFQALVEARFEPKRPDRVLSWTGTETLSNSEDDQPYLIEPFMNAQVSWDSEFYLSIATTGYDDPLVRTLPAPQPAAVQPAPEGGISDPSRGILLIYPAPDEEEETTEPVEQLEAQPLSLNYAFFPFYPCVMRVVAFPLKLLGLTPIATSTLAGVIVSLLGTLGAMIALYDLTRDELQDAGAIRAAFYLLIFPTGFFLAQVYTEGLFCGLSFGSLALVRRRKWVWAALLAACATWTRAVGIALIIPLAIAWVQELNWKNLIRRPDKLSSLPWEMLGKGLLVLAPLAAYLVWHHFLGDQFSTVEDNFFSRGALLFTRSLFAWLDALRSVSTAQTAVYYGIEVASMLLALVASLLTLKKYPGAALFGLAVLVISVTSGVPQSVARYVLPVPSIYILLSRLGQNEAFDRAWTTASILLMGLLATLFTFDMWVA